MYEKAGVALKKFVSRFVSIEMGLCIFVGLLIFMLGVYTLNAPGDNTVSVILCVSGILITVIGSFIIWLKYLMLAAFAELVEETKKTSDNLVEIKDYIFYEKKPVDEVRFSAQTSGNKEQHQSSNFANDQLKEVNGMRFSEVNGEKTYYYNTEK